MGPFTGGNSVVEQLHITTAGGSTYIVGPGQRGRMRVRRFSDHVVRGTLGPLAFDEEFDRVELVSDGVGLKLQCTAQDGTAFHTSLIREVRRHSAAYAGTASP